MNINRIKRTRLGRLWLAAFVELVWQSLYTTQRERLLEAVTNSRGCFLLARKRLDVPVRERCRYGVVDNSLSREFGLVGEIVSDHRRLTRRKLTPLGLEVLKRGRKRKR